MQCSGAVYGLYLGFIIDKFVDKPAAVCTAVGDGFVDAVSHLLNFQPTILVLLYGVVVDALALRTHLLMKRGPQSRLILVELDPGA